MKRKKSMRREVVAFFLCSSFLTVGVSVSLSPSWVMSPEDTILSWALLGIAMFAFLEADEKFVQFFRTQLFSFRCRLEVFRLQRELNRKVPGWNWREKGG